MSVTHSIGETYLLCSGDHDGRSLAECFPSIIGQREQSKRINFVGQGGEIRNVENAMNWSRLAISFGIFVQHWPSLRYLFRYTLKGGHFRRHSVYVIGAKG